MAAAAPADPELLEALLDGARYGDAEDVKAALAQGVGVNAQDEGGRTGVCRWAAREKSAQD